jgi:AraC family transcriptional regulator, exoenzyme S synthesis regulatory protein ExsA
MLNIIELVRGTPAARTFVVGDLCFAKFTCPKRDRQPIGLWSQADYLVHFLSAKMTWRTSSGTWSASAGETVFFKKGAYTFPAHPDHDLCLFEFFIPDTFVREIVRELAADLPLTAASRESPEPFIRVNQDVGLSAFLQAMNVYFAGSEKPPAPLLKLKLRELITSLLISAANPQMSAYFRSVARDAPSVPAIMEANFHHNLSLEVFAQMCHRSLSSFKREFRMHYGMSPGRWLLERRLECSAHLLRTTNLSLTEIVFECGFEGSSHFSRAFKEKFGQPPSAFREACTVMA